VEEAGRVPVSDDCGTDPISDNGPGKMFFNVLASVAEFSAARRSALLDLQPIPKAPGTWVSR